MSLDYAERHDDVAFGVFTALPRLPEGIYGEMRCPRCNNNSIDAWEPLTTTRMRPSNELGEGGIAAMLEEGIALGRAEYVRLDWMRCSDPECEQLVVRLHKTLVDRWIGSAPVQTTKHRMVYPVSSGRPPLDPVIPEEFRRDYEEAAAILELSPRMTTVLTSKVLYDLLEQYAQISGYTLKGSISQFVADTSHPKRIRENLDHWREIRDFSAHTKRSKAEPDDPNEPARIIEPTQVEAEWTLEMLDRLFEYFVIEPSRDEQLRTTWDQHLEDAGRNPIPPVPDSDG